MGERKHWISFGAACASVLLVALGAVSAQSVEGSVRGESTVSGSDADQKDYYWKVWNGALPEQRDKTDYSDVVAVLTGKFTGPPLGCKFAFRGGGLSPSTLVARTGTSIRVENRDGFTHELSVEGLAGFTPLEAGPGKARVVNVPAGGPWPVGDRIYGHVDGYLHSMRELVACATVAGSGKFRFEAVPPGPYTLRILRGSEQVSARRITVPAGKTVQVDPLTMSKGRRK
ncbi:MAG: carboxypeptidase-like regulatory domain-containing protein [Polyangiales bacterium]